MRLIEAKSLLPFGPPRFREFFDSEVPKYAILSHRWGDQEVTYQEVTDPHFWERRTDTKEGYVKIQNAARYALGIGCEWVWSDTCCIDKRSSAELTESINSMYAWYRDAEVCFAYLVDWPSPELSDFTQSVWFTRCWTLQELIAPWKLVFCDKLWQPLGTKHDLVDAVSARTKIDRRVLLKEERLDKFSIAQRMSWSVGRRATRTEDVAYCLLGLFDVNMPMLYGEGKKAFVRLQEEIMQRNWDQSIFVWTTEQLSKRPLALKPDEFAGMGGIRQMEREKRPFTMTNLGIEIKLVIRPIKCNTYAASLACGDGRDGHPVSLILEYDPETRYFTRTGCFQRHDNDSYTRDVSRSRKVTILRSIPDKYLIPPPLYGFRLGGQCKSLVLVNDWDPKHYWDIGRWGHEAQALPGSVPIFKIPDGEAPSIATMILLLDKVRLLVQLTFDFDFNPCCYISRQQRASVDPFEFHYSEDDENEKLFEWIDQDTGWTKNLRYMEIKNNHPLTKQSAWAAKSLSRDRFVAQVPSSITKPHTNLEVDFSLKPDVLDWVFDIRQTGETGSWSLTFPIVGYGQQLRDHLSRYNRQSTEV